MTSVRDSVLARFEAHPERVWTPVDFVDVAARPVVDKTLQRLTNEGVLRRLDRGLYDKPGFNPLTGRQSVPKPQAVIDAIARRDQLRVLIDGMTAANDLGLTDAVPARVTAHTERRLKPVDLGNMRIEFKPTTTSKLFWAGRPAMRLVQALYWLRDMLLRPGERAVIEARVRRVLDCSNGSAELVQDLLDGWVTLPGWMQDFLRPLLPPETAQAKAR
jgi:hypothetical protein